MLEAIKLSLRITGNEFDTEIKDIIAGGKLDLTIAGIVKIGDDDPLILRALTLYAKAHWGFNNAGEKYLDAYEALKVSLRLAGDYNA